MFSAFLSIHSSTTAINSPTNGSRTSPSNKPKPWESTGSDIFPSISVNGNYTDSEKEIRTTGTRSEGRQTPKMKKSSRTCSEKHLDSLYLRASQPKVIDHAYAQLKPTDKCKTMNFNNFDKINGDYVQLKYNEEKFNLSTASSTNTKRQILLAITENYTSDMIQVSDWMSIQCCFNLMLMHTSFNR